MSVRGADDRAAQLLRLSGRELRDARRATGLTARVVAQRLGWSRSKVTRIERAASGSLTVADLCRLSTAVGLEPSLRFFPNGRPLRDIGQVRLLAELNRRMHRSWRTRQEVPMPTAGDLRAADQLSVVPGCRLMVEAYTRLTDLQAQIRAARIKQRDLGAERLLVVLEDTHANRAAIAAAAADLAHTFPVTPRRMLGALSVGLDPGGDGILLLRGRRGASGAPGGAPGAPRVA